MNARPEKASQLIAAARKVFLQHGFSAASTDMIQAAAGVSKSTMYAHFPNKEALFAAVIEEGCATFLSAVRALRLPESTLTESLTAVGRAYFTDRAVARGAQPVPRHHRGSAALPRARAAFLSGGPCRHE